jgi:hypothetical protein
LQQAFPVTTLVAADAGTLSPSHFPQFAKLAVAVPIIAATATINNLFMNDSSLGFKDNLASLACF